VSKPEPTTQSKPVEADESIGNIIGKDSVPSGDRVEPLERLMPDSKTGFLDDYTFGVDLGSGSFSVVKQVSPSLPQFFLPWAPRFLY
jgi:hypothetical protein